MFNVCRINERDLIIDKPIKSLINNDIRLPISYNKQMNAHFCNGNSDRRVMRQCLQRLKRNSKRIFKTLRKCMISFSHIQNSV